MDNKALTLQELAEKGGTISSKQALVGFDGFIDKLMTAVDQRHGQGDRFDPIPTITHFGNRILGAAGKSTNIELYLKMEKLGGNGPIMANALANGGLQTRYIGALGYPSIHPVFEDFAKTTQAVSLADPGVTHALEFNDGKIMLGTMASLDEITYPQILEAMGEGAFMDCLSRTNLIAMVNWTMIPNMTAIFNALVDRALPNLGASEQRQFFFDLADPAKRSDGDISEVLSTIARFQNYGSTTLGLNLKEAQHIYDVLGFSPVDPDPDGLKRMAMEICQKLDIGTVMVHPTDSAACATKEDAWHVKGPYCEKPVITTGAGDHFNAGFSTAQILGLSPTAALTVATAFSGFYVRTAKSPSLNDIDTFIRTWQ